jgi:hypothetical protein
MDQTCISCGDSFSPNPRVKGQSYCFLLACQKQRKALWQKGKLHTDLEYKSNQASAQRAWCGKNPDYWREYRKTHPAYVARNRELQRERNRKWRGKLASSTAPDSGVVGNVPVAVKGEESIAKRTPLIAKNEAVIAKMDASKRLESGVYRLAPFFPGMIANMDAIIVQISVIQAKSVDCKDRTR